MAPPVTATSETRLFLRLAEATGRGPIFRSLDKNILTGNRNDRLTLFLCVDHTGVWITRERVKKHTLTTSHSFKPPLFIEIDPKIIDTKIFPLKFSLRTT